MCSSSRRLYPRRYKTIAEAAAAYDSLNGSDINDRKIRLDYTKNKPRDKDSIAERGEQPEKYVQPTPRASNGPAVYTDGCRAVQPGTPVCGIDG